MSTSTPREAGWASPHRILRSLALGAAIAMTACTTTYTPGVWVGATFPELRKAFGDPEAILINARANRVYVFREYPQDRSTVGTPVLVGSDELVMKEAGCAILFEMGDTTVIAWDWEGEACADVEMPLPYQVRNQTEI